MLPKFAATKAYARLTQSIYAPLAALPRAYVVNSMVQTPQRSARALALVVMAHVGVFAALASLRMSAVPMSSAVMMVEAIRMDAGAQKGVEMTPRKPTLAPPRPKPALRQSRPAAAVATPLLAAENSAPTPSAEVAQVVQPVALPSMQVSAQSAGPSQTLQAGPRFDANYLNNPVPIYPPLSRRAGEQGKVVLRVFVEPSGLPGRVEVRTSSGFERLDNAATAAVSRWKFIPARLGNDLVGAWVLVPINFSLKV